MVRTNRGGWLLAGEFAPGAFVRPYLVETDAQLRVIRQRIPVLFSGGGNERVNRVYNNIISLRDGSGYVLSGSHSIGGQTWGFLAKFDTDLNIIWTYRHPPQGTTNLNPTKVRELPDGSLVLLASDGAAQGQALTNRMYFIRVSATGQLLGQRTFTSTACSQLLLYDWLLLPTGGAIVTGGYADCGTQQNVAYTAHIDSATVLRAPTPTRLAGNGSLFPNPAVAQATWQGAVPVAARHAVLRLLDALGRQVAEQLITQRGPDARQAISLHGLPNGQYSYQLLVDGQPVAAPRKLVVIQ